MNQDSDGKLAMQDMSVISDNLDRTELDGQAQPEKKQASLRDDQMSNLQLKTWWQKYLLCCFKWDTDFNDVCIELFKIDSKDVKEDKNDESQYFMKQSEQEFMDLLDQLQMLVSEVDKEDFKRFREQEQESQGLIGPNASHRQVLQFFKEAHDQKWITEKNITQLLDFRKVAIDIFSLTDFQNDQILYDENHELDLFWEEINKWIESSKQQQLVDSNLLEDFQNKIDNDKSILKQATFHDIQQLLWDYHINFLFDIEQFQSNFYSGQVRFSRCCCPCKMVRKYLMKQKLQPKNPRQNHYGLGRVVSQIFSQFVHIFDIFTDCELAFTLYQLSREDLEENNQSFTHHYNIAFTMVAIAILGPYIIQYSTMMNILNIKGHFKREKYRTLPWFKKIYLNMSFLVLGLAIMPIVDLALKLQLLILTILHLLDIIKYPCNSQTSIAEWGQQYLEWLFEVIFDLNSVELENFEKQKKYIQVTFEDFIMVMLQILIQFQIMNVPKITMYGESKQASIKSAASTLLSIFSTLFQLIVESEGYQEDALEYIIRSMKAKPDWIPFGYIIKNNEIKFNVDFTIIELRLPYITTILGYYQTQEFQFSESNLKQLAAILDVSLTNHQALSTPIRQQSIKEQRDLESRDPGMNMSIEPNQNEQDDQQNDKKFIPRLKFGFSLLTISVHTFLSFINKTQQRHKKYVYEYLDFNDINWEQLVMNSKLQKLDLIYGRVDSGKPLLQVCIENEDSKNHRWQLKPLMEILLKAKDGCDPNVIDENEEYTMLSYCYKNKKHQAFKLLVKTDTEVTLNLNQQNPINGSTVYGNIFKQGVLLETLQSAHHQEYFPFEKLEILFQNNNGQHGIDIHKNQVESADKLVTPIHFYLDRITNKKDLKTLEAMKQDQKFKLLFGTTEFKLQNEQEIQQLLSSSVIEKRCELSDCLVKEAQDTFGGSLNHAFDSQDEQGNNFMHLTGCRVADQKWSSYLNSGLVALKNIAKKQLKQKNFNEQTPIQTMLKDDSNKAIKVKGLQKLFDLDLVDSSTFVGIEQDVINGFFQRAIKHYQTDPDKPFIDRIKFYEAFHDICKAYQTMKDRFTISNQIEIFEEYFQDDNIEQIIDNSHKDCGTIEDYYSQVNQKSLEEVLGKEVYSQNNEIKLLKDNSHSIRSVLGESSKQQNQLSKKRKEERHFICETILNGVIEMASALDFISDLYVVYQLSLTQHTSWFSFSLFTLLAPYLTVQQSAISYKVVQIRDEIEKNKQKITGYCTILLWILPTFIVMLITFDLIFMVISFFIYIGLFIGLCTKSRRRIHDKFSDIMNKFFKYFFQMTAMDVQNFKNQRTILQLHLESVPQIVFQIYVLINIRNDAHDTGDKTITSNDITHEQFSVSSIAISLLCAIIHVILELVDLYLKSKTSETSFKNYMAASYSARLGWLPQGKDLYEEYFNQQEKQPERGSREQSYVIRHNSDKQSQYHWTESDTDEDEEGVESEQAFKRDQNLESKSQKSKMIQFDNKNKQFKYFGYSVTFEFSDNTINYLFNLISNMKQVDHKFKGSLKTIKLNECIQNLSLSNVIQLIRLAHNKIRLKFDEEVLGTLMEEDEQFKMYIKDPDNHKAESPFHKDEYLLIEMIVLGNAQFLRLMIQKGAKLDLLSLQTIKVKGKQNQKIEKNSNVFEIAYQMQGRKCLAVLLEMKELLNPNQIEQAMQHHEILYNELLRDIKKSVYWVRPLHPHLLLDPSMLVPNDLMSSFNYNSKSVIEKNPEFIEERWHILYGAYMLDFDLQGQTKFISMIENIVKWIQCYPKKIGIIQRGLSEESDQVLELDRRFLSQFTLIRRMFHTRSKLSMQRNNFKKNLDVTAPLKQIKCDLSDILVLYKLYHNQEPTCTIEQLARCDDIVKTFGFDKNWSQYYHYSRNFYSTLNEDEYIETMEVQDYQLDTILSDDTLSIKELTIQTTNDYYDKIDSREQAHTLKFYFKMPHFSGKIDKIQLPAADSFNLPTDFNPSDQNQLLAAISFSSLKNSQSTSSSYNYMFIRFHQTLLNSITAGHEITVQVFEGGDNSQPVECIFRLKLVRRLRNVRNVEVEYQQCGEGQGGISVADDDGVDQVSGEDGEDGEDQEEKESSEVYDSQDSGKESEQ